MDTKILNKVGYISMLTFVLCICFAPGSIYADRPSPQTDQFTDDQMARWTIYSTKVSEGIYNQTVIMYDVINKKVDRREAITDLAVTLFNSTLSIKSMLNYHDVDDLLFLTTVLGVETDYIMMVSSGPVEKEIRSMLFAGIKTSLGSPTAFAKYCSTHTVSSIIKLYDAFQLWKLSKKINQATALNDLMWNYYAFGGNTDEIKAYYNIDDSYCAGTYSGFDCIVKYFSDSQNVDYEELTDGALSVLRYVNNTYRNLQNIEKQTPSTPILYDIQDGINPSRITFSWGKSDCESCGKVTYNLEVHKGGNAVFKADDYEGHLISNTSYTLPITLDPNTTYYWAVFPKSQYGIWNLDTGERPGFTTGTTASNTQPHADFTLSQGTGTTATIFNVNASGSYDPDGDSIEYGWNWGDSPGFTPWSSTSTASHTFQSAGNYNITLCVRDASTESYNSKSVIVSQANTPPAQVINMNPGNDSFNNPVDTDISWADGGGADSYDIYFGKDPDPSNNIKVTQNQTLFDPGILEYNTTYYRRIDPVNPYGTTTGNVWSFTTDQPPPWIGYFYWDFDTDGTEGWTARNAAGQGIYNNDYWIIDPEPDTASKSGIISSPNLAGIYAGFHDTIQVRAAVKSEFVPFLQAHLVINDEWLTPITLNYVSGEQLPDSQCVYKGSIPYSGRIQQVRIDFVDRSDSVDDRVYIDKVEFLNLYDDSINIISGYIRDAQGNGISNVILEFSNDAGSTIADSTGFYSKEIRLGWSGTVTPYRALYSFYPSSVAYSNVSSSQTGNYTGTPPDNSSSETINFPEDQEYSGANDGFVFNHGFDDYPTIQGADEANEVSRPDYTTMLIVGQDRAFSGEYYVYRASIPFDTGSLPDDCIITGARLYMYGYDEDYSHTDFDLEIVPSGQATVSALSNGDYGNFGTASGGSIDSGMWQGHNGINCIPLNITGISWINKTGFTVLGLRSSRDISQSQPFEHEFIY